MTYDFGAVILASDLNSNLGLNRAAMTTLATGRKNTVQIDKWVAALSSTGGAPDAIVFTPRVDLEVRAMGLYKTGAAAADVLTAALSCVDDGRLLGFDVNVALTAAGTGAEHATRNDYTGESNNRLVLYAGLQYELTLTKTGATLAHVHAFLVCRTRARPRFAPSLPAHLVRTGQHLGADWMNRIREDIQREHDELIGNRYTESFFIVPIGALTNTSTTGAHRVLVKAPFAYDIVGVDLVVCGTAGTYILTCSGVTGASTLSTTTDGTTTHSPVYANWQARVAAATEVSFILSTTLGAYTVTESYAIVHIRHDRHQAAPPTNWAPPDLKTGDHRAHAGVSAMFSSWNAAVAVDAAATTIGVIQIVPNASTQSMQLPATQRVWTTADFYFVAAAGRTITSRIRDKVPTTQATATFAGGGATTTSVQGVAVTGDPQVDDDPDDSADDWIVDNTMAGAGTIEKIYTVLYGTTSA
jgi:hypothetical protein